MSYDLSKLYIKLDGNSSIGLLDQHPELSAFPEFRNAINDDEIKIAILSADIESPFVIGIRDRETMLKSIFDFLNIPVKTQSQVEFFNEVLHYKHTRVMDCWIRYIQIIHDTDWTDWLMAQQTYNFLIFESQIPREEKETSAQYLDRRLKIQANIKKIGAEVKAIEAKIFPDSKAAREASMYETKRIISYPEKYSVDRQVI